MLVVSLDDFGRLYVTNPQPIPNLGISAEKPKPEPVTQQQLYSTLASYQQTNPNGPIVLHASRNVSYNEVAQVLDTLRQVGGNRVALATLPGEASSTNNSSPNLPSSPNAIPQLNLPSNP